MKTELMVLIGIIAMLAMIFLPALLGRVNAKIQWPRWRRGREQIALANDPQDGVHLGGRLTRRADGAVGRNLLIKAGTDAAHVAVAGAADEPYGITQDEGEAAEDLVNIQSLACADRTVRCITDGSAAIVFGDTLVPATGGKVKKISAAGGNYYIVGKALTAPVTADGELLEVLPIGAWKTQ